jgi:radical SAM enzyme (TIGR01210 family)
MSIIPNNVDLAIPQSIKSDQIFFNNKILRRKRIVLLAPACIAATCTMCPLPNEALDIEKRPITPRDLIKQFENSFKNDSIDNYDIITIYNNGNFFADYEIPPQVRQYIYHKLGKSKASYFIVESLPQFITKDKLSETRKLMGEKQLVVTIGLQSANDIVRELAVNTSCSKKVFEEAIILLRHYNYLPLAYLMVKPPFLTEKEAVEDTVESIGYLSSLGINEPILCATKVSPNTVAYLMYTDGIYHPPWLWTVLEILKESIIRYSKSKPRVNTSEIIKEKNKGSLCTQNCDKCNDKVIEMIEKYNLSQNTGVLHNIKCDCRKLYQKFLQEEEEKYSALLITDRIADFLKNHKIS